MVRGRTKTKTRSATEPDKGLLLEVRGLLVELLCISTGQSSLSCSP